MDHQRRHPWRHLPSGPWYTVLLLVMCAGPLSDAIFTATHFGTRLGAVMEMGLVRPGPAAVGLAIYEVTACFLVLRGMLRRYGALALALLAMMRMVVDLWSPAGRHGTDVLALPEVVEPLSIAAAFVLVAWLDFAVRRIAHIENESW